MSLVFPLTDSTFYPYMPVIRYTIICHDLFLFHCMWLILKDSTFYPYMSYMCTWWCPLGISAEMVYIILIPPFDQFWTRILQYCTKCSNYTKTWHFHRKLFILHIVTLKLVQFTILDNCQIHTESCHAWVISIAPGWGFGNACNLPFSPKLSVIIARDVIHVDHRSIWNGLSYA